MIAEKEFLRINEDKSEKEITIISSESKLPDQIRSPILLALVMKKIAAIKGIKIKKAAIKKPNK
jgi:hypothetical protein